MLKIYKTLKSMDVKNKRVIVRVDHNVSLNQAGVIEDDRRISHSISTIKYLLENDCKIIIITHLGRPKGKSDPKLKTDVLAKRLSMLIGQDVKKLDECIGENVKEAVENMQPKDIIYLENLRFYEGEKSKDEKVRDEFGKQLADLADVYVNEAFSNCHRDHASMTSISKFIPGCAGFGLEEELEHLKNAINNPKRPFIAIFGGVKKEKMEAAKTLLNNVDKLIPCGALLNALLKAKGIDVKKSLVNDEALVLGKEIIGSDKLIWPEDVLIGNDFNNNANKKIVDHDKIDDNWMILGIGPKTIEKYKKELKKANTIIWSGTVDVFEFNNFNIGSKEIAAFVADLTSIRIIGGGDSAAVVDNLGLSDAMTYVSTGGGASLTLFQGKELVGVKALE